MQPPTSLSSSRRFATNQSSSTTSLPTIESLDLNATTLSDPPEGGLVRWEDWAFGGNNYRDPRAPTSQVAAFAHAMLASVITRFQRSGANIRSDFPDGSIFIYTENTPPPRRDMVFRLVGIAPGEDALSWEEVLQAANGFMRWSRAWDSTMIPSFDIIFIDHWQFVGIQVGAGSFTISSADGQVQTS